MDVFAHLNFFHSVMEDMLFCVATFEAVDDLRQSQTTITRNHRLNSPIHADLRQLHRKMTSNYLLNDPIRVVDLRQLQTTVMRNRSVLDHEPSEEIKLWLSEQEVLKEAAEIAEEFEYEMVRAKVQQQQQQADTSPKGKRVKLDMAFASTFFSSSDNILNLMHGRINRIQERFYKIAKARSPALSCHQTPLPQIFSPAEFKNIYGRDEERQKLIKWLVSNKTINFAVVAIVGEGGLGKTTLAKLIYNDRITKNYFDIKVWLTVSRHFDVDRLTREMLENITWPPSYFRQFSLLQVQDALREKLAGKRVLLVMDDMWNEERTQWEFFKGALAGTQLLRVIVTTRNQAVANVLVAQEIYPLSYLSEEESWKFFSNIVFWPRDPNEYPQLVDIGKRIVKICGGLPLLLKSLGKTLKDNLDESRWSRILQELEWEFLEDGKFLSLKSTYQHLPNYLKPCFLICCMFPKGYVFEKTQLTRLWVALGYIQITYGRALEKIANAYFDELLQRSFFDTCHGEESYKMHDIFHDLAKCLTKMSDIRRLHALVLDSDVDAFQGTTSNLQHLRYLSIPSQIKLHESVCHMYNLRFLDLCYFQGTKLPNEIGNLINLVYLILRCSNIQQLPESISQLFKIQMLDLYGCRHLEELPCTIIKLTNLWILDLYNSSVRCLPSEFSKLTKLKRFYAVLSEMELRQLKHLLNLEGMLCIENIRFLCPEDCKEATLGNKHQLESLKLFWHANKDRPFVQERQHLCFRNYGSSVMLNDDQRMLECLEPHINLRELEINGYEGLKFPIWISNPSFSKLTKIQLVKCSAVTSLPAVGQLPCLVSLLIKEFSQIKSIGSEFCTSTVNSNNILAFPSLRHLQFEVMYQWEEWNGILDGDFPQLQELIIKCCPRMKSFVVIAGLLKYLKKLVFCPGGGILPTCELDSW